MRRYVLVIVALLSVGGASRTRAQNPVVAPVTIWPYPCSNCLVTTGLATDPGGAVYLLVSSGRGGSPQIVRLDSQASTFTTWTLPSPGPTIELTSIAFAPDGTGFFGVQNPQLSVAPAGIARFDPSSNLLTVYQIPVGLLANTENIVMGPVTLDLSNPNSPLVWASLSVITTTDFGSRSSLGVIRLDPSTDNPIDNLQALFLQNVSGDPAEGIALDPGGTLWFSFYADEGLFLASLVPGAATGTIYGFGTMEDGARLKVDPVSGKLFGSVCGSNDPHIALFDLAAGTETDYVPVDFGSPCGLDVSTKVYFSEPPLAGDRGGLPPGNIDRFATANVSGTTFPLNAEESVVPLPATQTALVALFGLSPSTSSVSPTTTNVTSQVNQGFETFPMPSGVFPAFDLTINGCGVFFSASGELGELVTPAEEPLTNLKDRVAVLVKNGVLNKGLANSLISKLNNAQANFQKANRNAADNQIGAFINQTNGLARAGILSLGQANTLVGPARSIMLSCAA